jgi:hypothetical protein
MRTTGSAADTKTVPSPAFPVCSAQLPMTSLRLKFICKAPAGDWIRGPKHAQRGICAAAQPMV